MKFVRWCVKVNYIDTYHRSRAGDVASSYADPARAEKLPGWRALRELDAICADAWRW